MSMFTMPTPARSRLPGRTAWPLPAVEGRRDGPVRDARQNLCLISMASLKMPNYGERHRYGEPVSGATADATVRHVIDRRMVNNDLADDLVRRYPGRER
ncbi:hypothetical protein ACQP1W_33830 [Spirillospora sp. CA-255316]